MTTAAIAAVSAPNGLVRVINATYAELGPTSVRSAIRQVARGTAIISEHDPERGTLHAEGLAYPWPTVIRLLKVINVPFYVGDQHFSKAGVRKRDNNTCAYCRKPGDTVDHIFPQDRGGKDTWMNTVCACSPCNGKKRNRTPEEAEMPLLFQPHTPQRIYLTGGKRHKKNK